jgi:hypothetical protein
LDLGGRTKWCLRDWPLRHSTSCHEPDACYYTRVHKKEKGAEDFPYRDPL